MHLLNNEAPQPLPIPLPNRSEAGVLNVSFSNQRNRLFKKIKLLPIFESFRMQYTIIYLNKNWIDKVMLL